MAAETGPWPLIELKDTGNREWREERRAQGDWKQRVRRVGGGVRNKRECKRMT